MKSIKLLGTTLVAALLALQLSGCIPFAGQNIGFLDRNFVEKLHNQRDAQHIRIEELRGFSEGVAWGQRSDGHFVLLDHSGKTKAFKEFQVSTVSDFSEGLAAVRERKIDALTKKTINGEVGFVDQDLNWRIPPRFTNCNSFAEGLAAVEIDGAWGFIDRDGKVAISPRFQSASVFSEGLCEVCITTPTGIKSGFIDHSGNFVIAPKFDKLYAHLVRKTNPGWEELMMDGSELRFDGRPMIEHIPAFGIFKHGLAPVCIGGRIGFIDHHGKFVISPKYAYASSFSEGKAIVSADSLEKFGFIDVKGNVAISEKFRFVLPFKSGLACGIVGSIMRDDFSYFNHDGIKQGSYSSRYCGSFSEGVAPFGMGTVNPPWWNRDVPMSMSM